LQPASALDSLPPHDRTEAEIRKLALAVDVLREMGEAGNVNANEAQVGGPGLLSLGVRVPCLETQPCSSDYGNPVVPIGWWDLRLSPDGDRIQEVHETPVPGERNVRTAHRIAFVAGHPELLGPQRDLILAGWVGYGMSEQMVCAAWGAPVERTVERDGVALRYMRAGADLVRSQVTLRFRENGLQIGW
jgi:hypothetical protein